MTNEQISSILNKVVKEKYPEMDVKISVITERDPLYIFSTGKLIYNIIFNLSYDDFHMYNFEGLDKPKWDEIRAMLRDVIKMIGIFDKVKFQFHGRDEFPTLA
jgi:hypothetical protein